MTPRRYRMDRRRRDVEATRQRIVEATLALHSERGILGTSWRDIAERADVSVATVYKHFPTLDELVPACGALMESITLPPSPDDAAATFAGVRGLGQRVGRLVETFYAFYARGEAYLEVDLRERELPMVQEWEAYARSTREAYVREAVAPDGLDDATVHAIAALLDFPLYRSFRRHGLSQDAAASVVGDILLCRIRGARSSTPARRKR